MINKITNEMLKDLRDDNSSGANQLIDKVIEIIEAELINIEDSFSNISSLILELSKQIIESQPSMAPLINVIGFLVGNLDEITKKNLLVQIQKFRDDKKRRERELENNFQTFLINKYKPDLKLMLISYSSTIIESLLHLNGLKLEIFILESRPLFEGRKSAEKLSAKYKTNLIIDAAIGKYINNIDLVLIGIDSVLRDGSIINKIGTYPLSVVANENNIKIYAVGDSFKYNLKSHFGKEPLIQPKPKNEVYEIELINQNIIIQNYYFDITPSKYITGIISDLGVLKVKSYLRKVREYLQIDWFRKFQ